MQALWNHIVGSWPVVAPEPVLTNAIGKQLVRALLELRLLRSEPIREHSRYPCEGCPRGRQVVRHEGTWAVCTCPSVSCEPVDLSASEQLELDDRALTLRVRGLLELAGPFEPTRWNRVALLGERRIGVERIVFGFVPRPLCVSTERLGIWLARQQARTTVLLAPTRDSRLTATPSGAGRVVWLSLEEVVDVEEGTADLSELALRVALPSAVLGELLWPRFSLVLEAGRYSYAGQTLGLERHPRVADLLRTLAERPGQWVSRRDLVLAVYPDEITNRGKLLTDPVKLERRLRQLVSDLGKAFKAVDPRGFPANPIENLRSRSDLEGGYRLALSPERVFMRSRGA